MKQQTENKEPELNGPILFLGAFVAVGMYGVTMLFLKFGHLIPVGI